MSLCVKLLWWWYNGPFKLFPIWFFQHYAWWWPVDMRSQMISRLHIDTVRLGIPDHLTYRVKTLRPRQNGCHFADGIFKCIFLNKNVWISINISLTFVPKGQINNIPALVWIMTWRQPGDKPLSAPMMVSLLTHMCVTQPQWVNKIRWFNVDQMI